MRAIEWTKRAARAAFVSAPIAFVLAASAPAALADGMPSAHAHVPAAHPRAHAQGASETSHDIRVPLDQAVILRLSEPAGGVAIGNPSIAGVSVQNDHMLFVTGRAYGTTNLVVIDGDGRTIYSGRVTVAADETGVVVVTRGNEMQRLDCAPLCRPRPDIGDGRTYETVSTQI